MVLAGLRSFGVLVLMAASWGCATTRGRDCCLVDIDSISAEQTSSKTKYLLLSGDPAVSTDDLQFKEYASYLERALAAQGYQRVEASKRDAEVAIFFTYWLGEADKFTFTDSVPVFGQTGVSAGQTSGTAYTFGNTTSYSSTTSYTPTYGIVGSRSVSTTIISFPRSVHLAAYDLTQPNTEGHLPQLWRTFVFSGGSTADLRLVLPVMIAGAAPYLGKNTGKSISVLLRPDDPAVDAIKGLPPDTRAKSDVRTYLDGPPPGAALEHW